MIVVLVAALLTVQAGSGPAGGGVDKARTDVCLAHGEQLSGLLDALDRPEDDVASSVVAATIQLDCSMASTLMSESEWTAPCGRLLASYADAAEAVRTIFQGQRARDDVPSLIYSGWQSDAVRCYEISQLKGEQP